MMLLNNPHIKNSKKYNKAYIVIQKKYSMINHLTKKTEFFAKK